MEKELLTPQINSPNLNQTQKHFHNGVDTPRLNPKYFLGFPITKVADATATPTLSAQNGQPIFQYDGTHFYMWIRINNLWKHVALS